MKKDKTQDDFTISEIRRMLSLTAPDDLKELFAKAYGIKKKYTGQKVYLRGLVEISNICRKNCFYCGIRRDNENVSRYSLTEDEIVETALIALKRNYGSVVLQSGERKDEEFISLVEKSVSEIKKRSGGKLGITLSMGEQSEDTYKRWFDAGAHRYLLRIETSNPELYGKLHPEDHSFGERIKCLETLQTLGYQTGTGVMIGLPGQSFSDLAADIDFFRNSDMDMIGMGPYILHQDTPLAGEAEKIQDAKNRNFELGLKMIAVTRIVMKDINIAATTALHTLDPEGREKGVMAGANVIMPNITSPAYKIAYQLYEGKPGLRDDPGESPDSLEKNLKALGEQIVFGEWGDSQHYFKRMQKKKAGGEENV